MKDDSSYKLGIGYLATGIGNAFTYFCDESRPKSVTREKKISIPPLWEKKLCLQRKIS